jgi:hypothetical protein
MPTQWKLFDLEQLTLSAMPSFKTHLFRFRRDKNATLPNNKCKSKIYPSEWDAENTQVGEMFWEHYPPLRTRFEKIRDNFDRNQGPIDGLVCGHDIARLNAKYHMMVQYYA